MPAAKLGLGVRYESVRRLMEVLPSAHAADIVFTGVGKSADELRRAIALGVKAINAESPGEVERIAAIARLT